MDGVNTSLDEKMHGKHSPTIIIFSIALVFVVILLSKVIGLIQVPGLQPTGLHLDSCPLLVAGLLGRCDSSPGRDTGPEQDDQTGDGEESHLLLFVLWLSLRIRWQRPAQRCHRLVTPPNHALPLPRDPPLSSPSIYSFGTMC